MVGFSKTIKVKEGNSTITVYLSFSFTRTYEVVIFNTEQMNKLGPDRL